MIQCFETRIITRTWRLQESITTSRVQDNPPAVLYEKPLLSLFVLHTCISINYASPIEGKMLLVVNIEKLWRTFATCGILDVIVSDNGQVFTNDEFETFMKLYSIWHAKTTPPHPLTNGLTEDVTQTLKQSLKKSNTGSFTNEIRIFHFLFKYCNTQTPHPPL